MDVYMDRAHVRIEELPRHFKTRELRSDHIGKLLAIDGLVRTATEVRPKIVSAAFQCQRCGFTFFKEQTGNKFEDQNLKCMNQACDRGGPFKLMLAQSKFVDAQKIRVQESPEELRGGQQPQTWMSSWRMTWRAGYSPETALLSMAFSNPTSEATLSKARAPTLTSSIRASLWR